jgi:hypothetical protein
VDRDGLLDLLINPSKLSILSIEEVKSLVIEFPFAQNLRKLLYLKSTESKEDSKYQVYLGLYGIKLNSVVTLQPQVESCDEKIENESTDLSEIKEDSDWNTTLNDLKQEVKAEEVLEANSILDLSEDSKENLGIVNFSNLDKIENEVFPHSENAVLSHSTQENEEELDNIRNIFENPLPKTGKKARTIPKTNTSNPPTSKILDEELGIIPRFEELKSEKAKAPKKKITNPYNQVESETMKRPLPKEVFDTWRKRAQSSKRFTFLVPEEEDEAILQKWADNQFISSSIEVKKNPVLPEISTEKPVKHPTTKEESSTKKPSKMQRVKQMVEESVRIKEEVASETLAALLALQGYSDRAINIYESLSLRYPEKSSYFAAKIKEITN